MASTEYDNDADAFRDRMQNRNRHKRPRYFEGPHEPGVKDSSKSRPPKRRLNGSSDPDDGDSSSSGVNLDGMSVPNSKQQAATSRSIGAREELDSLGAPTLALFVASRSTNLLHRQQQQRDLVTSAGDPFSAIMEETSAANVTAGVHGVSSSSLEVVPLFAAKDPSHFTHIIRRTSSSSSFLSWTGEASHISPPSLNSSDEKLSAAFDDCQPIRDEKDWSRSAIMLSANRLASASNSLLGRLQQTTTVGLDPHPLLTNSMFRTEELYMDCDDDFLSEYQLILRKQSELFSAEQQDIDSFTAGRRKELSVGQVGIRCKHCAVLPRRERPRGAVYFPFNLPALYQAAQNMAIIHFTDTCQQISPQLKEQLIDLHEKKTVSGHGGKMYWAEGAVARGICETERGLWFQVGGRSHSVHPIPVTSSCGENVQ